MDDEKAERILKEIDHNLLFAELDKRGLLSEYKDAIVRETLEKDKKGEKDVAILSPSDAATELLRERAGAVKGHWDADEANALATLSWIAELFDSDVLRKRYGEYIYHNRGRTGQGVKDFIEAMFAGGVIKSKEDLWNDREK